VNRLKHYKMRRIILFLFFVPWGLFNDLNAQSINGLWKDTYWGPMTSYFKFDTLSSSFKSYYHDDTRGSFGKGQFSIKGNRIYLTFDSIICDRPIVERLDNDLMQDTTYIAFFQYWGFPKRIDIIENDKKLYSNWTSSSDSILEDHLFIKIPKILDSLEFVIYDSNGSVDKEVKRFKIRLYNKPFCNLYYYPCNSWYDFKNPTNRMIKIRWIRDDFFVIPGKYRFEFQKIN
jgi:hypothetical protein